MTDPASAIRAAVAGFGYDHLEIANATLRTPPVGGTPLERGTALVRLGGYLRSLGNCSGASSSWRSALTDLGLADGAGEAGSWEVRAHFGIGLCALASGDYKLAVEPLREVVQGAESNLQKRQALFAEAIALWELENPSDARSALRAALTGARDESDPIRAGFHLVQAPLGITAR